MDPAGASSANAMNSPTLSIHATQAGVILGTAAYMSPEQARGKAVDERTDVWAFGCLLYELLTGRRAFAGEDLSATIAAVLEREPDWTILPGTTPTSIRELLQRCLRKDSTRRLQKIVEARKTIERARRGRPRKTAAIATGPLAVLAIGGAVSWPAPANPPSGQIPSCPIRSASPHSRQTGACHSSRSRDVLWARPGLRQDASDGDP
jgi:serine/threonine protein kinase